MTEGTIPLKPDKPIQPGVFVLRGMGVRIPAGGLIINIDAAGKPEASLTLHVGLDVCPTWLDIAREHLGNAKEANAKLAAAADTNDEQAIATHMEQDLTSSMQSVVASAAAVDAFYSILRDFVQIDDATRASWRAKGTARYKQVAEVVRRAFKIKPRNAAQVRSALRQLFHYRDMSVHPDLSYTEASPHPEANRYTAKLLATFRYPNARELAKVAVSLIGQGCLTAQSPFPEVAKYCHKLRPRLEPVITQWEALHGEAFKRPVSNEQSATM